MKTSPWFALGFGSVLSLLAATAGGGEKWITARTEHFEMFSSAAEPIAREQLVRLEQFRAVVRKVFPLAHGHEGRVTIVLFSNGRQFRSYQPVRNGKSVEAAGYFFGSADEAVITMVAANALDGPGETIFHEYVHQLVAAGDRPLPIWINEGLAEVFSSFRILGDTYELGRAKADCIAALGYFHLMPLGQFFAVTVESPEYLKGPDQQVFYAQSWALVHWMVCGKNRETDRPKLWRFAELAETPGKAIDQSFREIFQMSYQDMEWKLKRYLADGSYFIRTDNLPLRDLSARIKFRPATDFERDAALINLQWRARETGSAGYQLLQMAESHPEAPRPHEILAAIALRDRDSAGALNHWRRAAELGSDNSYVYLQLARENLDEEMNGGITLDYRMPAERTAKLRGWLDRAVALSPDYPQAYAALAVTESLAAEPRAEVVSRLAELVPTMGVQNPTLFAIAIANWRLGHYAASQEIVERLLAGNENTPEFAAAVRDLWERLAQAARGDAAAATPSVPGPG